MPSSGCSEKLGSLQMFQPDLHAEGTVECGGQRIICTTVSRAGIWLHCFTLVERGISFLAFHGANQWRGHHRCLTRQLLVLAVFRGSMGL
jgi:hypothetical protein